MIGLEACLYGTHSLRRTKATLIYKKTGNLRAVQLLLGHTKIESTVRYLGSRSTTRLPWPSKSTSKNRGGAGMLPPNSKQARGHLLSSQRPIKLQVRDLFPGQLVIEVCSVHMASSPLI